MVEAQEDFDRIISNNRPTIVIFITADSQYCVDIVKCVDRIVGRVDSGRADLALDIAFVEVFEEVTANEIKEVKDFLELLGNVEEVPWIVYYSAEAAVSGCQLGGCKEGVDAQIKLLHKLCSVGSFEQKRESPKSRARMTLAHTGASLGVRNAGAVARSVRGGFSRNSLAAASLASRRRSFAFTDIVAAECPSGESAASEVDSRYTLFTLPEEDVAASIEEVFGIAE